MRRGHMWRGGLARRRSRYRSRGRGAPVNQTQRGASGRPFTSRDPNTEEKRARKYLPLSQSERKIAWKCRFGI